MSELLEPTVRTVSWRERFAAAASRMLAWTVLRDAECSLAGETERWAEIERASLRLPAATASAIKLLRACGSPGAELLEVQREPCGGDGPGQELRLGWLLWRDPWYDKQRIFRERTLYLLDDGTFYAERTTDGAVQHAGIIQEQSLRREYRDDLPDIVESLALLEAEARAAFGWPGNSPFFDK